jgi:hypothetical protein
MRASIISQPMNLVRVRFRFSQEHITGEDLDPPGDDMEYTIHPRNVFIPVQVFPGQPDSFPLCMILVHSMNILVAVILKVYAIQHVYSLIFLR